MRARGLAAAFGFALRGIGYAWHTQRNVRIQAGVAMAVVLVGAWLRVGALEWALLITAIALVLSAELLNTAIEAVVDLVSPQTNLLAGAAKDACAAGVVVAVVGAVLLGLFVLGPPLIDRVQLMSR
ncbi:MAG: diacylglycerol kinase family protein [Chloroflexi bacterium]|nr:diacylglycerol kinase family protein [Chloroflexota bacterium]